MNGRRAYWALSWGVLAVLLVCGGWLLSVNRRLVHQKIALSQSLRKISYDQAAESVPLEELKDKDVSIKRARQHLADEMASMEYDEACDKTLALIKEEIAACGEETEEELKKKSIFVHRLLMELRRLQDFDGKNLEDIMNEQREPGYLEKRKAAIVAATRGGLEKLDRRLDDLKTENLDVNLHERLGNFQADLQKLREDVAQQPQSSDERRELARNLHQQFAYSIIPEILEKHWGKDVEKHDRFLQQLFNVSTLYPIRQPID